MLDTSNLRHSPGAHFALAHADAGAVVPDSVTVWSGPTPLTTMLSAERDATEAGLILHNAIGVLREIGQTGATGARRQFARNLEFDLTYFIGGE